MPERDIPSGVIEDCLGELSTDSGQVEGQGLQENSSPVETDKNSSNGAAQLD